MKESGFSVDRKEISILDYKKEWRIYLLKNECEFKYIPIGRYYETMDHQ